jgi:hypothetical protein
MALALTLVLALTLALRPRLTLHRCTPLQPALHESCACAAAAANWSIACYNEEAMDAAAALLRASGCDEVSDGVPRCAVQGSSCYVAFQIVQAHHPIHTPILPVHLPHTSLTPPLHLTSPLHPHLHLHLTSNLCICLQAHHDYCHAADTPQAASDAFHEYVGSCSECHVLRDRLPDY